MRREFLDWLFSVFGAAVIGSMFGFVLTGIAMLESSNDQNDLVKKGAQIVLNDGVYKCAKVYEINKEN